MENKNRTIYILLTDTGTLFTRTIKWFTNAPYNHVSLAFDENLNEVYSFGRKKPKNPLFAGFVQEDVYHGTYYYFQNTRCTLLKYHVSEREYGRIRKVIEYFEENKEQFSYNLIGLIGVLINYPISKKNSYFCSQFVAEVLKQSGINLWNQPSALITPNDFLTQAKFEVIYTGKLYDYPLLNQAFLAHDENKKDSIYALLTTSLKKLLPLKMI